MILIGDTRLPTTFWRHVRLAGGCWRWTGPKIKRGYGHCDAGLGSRSPHRAAYLALVGPVGRGLELDHLCHTADAACTDGDACRHRLCVNPAHLEPVTHRVNSLRGRSPVAVNAAKTTCINGHRYDLVNTRYRVDGSRACRACGREKSRSQRAARARRSMTIPRSMTATRSTRR